MLGNKTYVTHPLLIVLLALWLGGCSDHDEHNESEKQAQPATKQVMVIFAPGQLGDNGYADKVFSGVFALTSMGQDKRADIDIEYSVSSKNEGPLNDMRAWVNDTVNAAYGNTYERRLLILTEHYMLEWLDSIAHQLRPTDEVLALKVNEADLRQCEASQKLGSRLHGANISAASSIRNYCKFMKVVAENMTFDDGTPISTQSVGLTRLYADTVRVYRDSIVETINEVWHNQVKVAKNNLFAPQDPPGVSSIWGADIVSGIALLVELAITTAPYTSPFNIYDLGAYNNSVTYTLIGTTGLNFTLLIDAEESYTPNRFIVSRRFDELLYQWIGKWMNEPTGSMPLMEAHGGWDGYCTDNLYGVNEDE